MKCDNCQKEETWLEIIGTNYICHKCMQKNKDMGFLFRTNIEMFKRVMKKVKPKNYQDYMLILKEQIEKAVPDLSKFGIKLK